MPDELAVQIPMVHAACEALGVPILTSERYEADDVIGTLATKAAADGFDKFRIALECEGDVGERAERDDCEAGIGADRFDHCIDSVLFIGSASFWFVAVIAETVFADDASCAVTLPTSVV